MVVRIHNLNKWACLKAGEALKLLGDATRKVRVEVNCEAPTRFDVVGEDDSPVFLAVVQGYEVLEFTAPPVADLVPSSEGEVWYFTNDGDVEANEAIQPEPFVSIMLRRERNPQLELMEWRMKQNERRRDEALAEERAAWQAALAAAQAAGADEETGELDGDSSGTAGGDQAGAAAPAGGGAAPAKAGAPMGQPEPAEFPLDTPVPGSFNEALRTMVNRDFMASNRHQDQHKVAVRAGAHPVILEFERLMIRRMAKLGVPMFASEVIRTRERQDELFALGVTRARAGKSPHQFGLAVDIVHGVKGWNLADKQWQLIGHTGKELAAQKGLKIEWGGDPAFGFWDPAHWQVKGWKALREQFPWEG